MMVVDSDVLIDALQGTSASERIDQELRTGARSERARGRVETLLVPLTILPFDERAGEKAAEAREELESQGTPIGMADCPIAGICLSRAASLLTRNRTYLARVDGLGVEELEPSRGRPL